MKRSASKQPQYKILTIDPWLKPYYSDIALRMQRRMVVVFRNHQRQF